MDPQILLPRRGEVHNSTPGLRVRIVAPSLLRLALSAVLSLVSDVNVVADPPAAVSIVAGGNWEERIQAPHAESTKDQAPRIVLICSSGTDLAEASGLGIQWLVSEDDDLYTLLDAVEAAARSEA